ncbi:ArsR family transcriptional regulator [Haloferax mediterranei ATCC 33500]|uniref:ArsR family transcriptional regulator n=1 Tax=Haloferax mediterranei (strain ATCC 33500 / DSM 1411 / JCM 8866 / NBRC 14739 / NCIMB 2177 / R-4) TaxID=523841 RepID=I3R5A4_HALMT|nr:helix-turn-helix domain-containing protein [Haloferax mediterranei]AFK19414.1 putative transcriptional regulator, ArsR family [Haloferax mediterranei ATCC 33500]AHZ21236.1 ArsR family transcriptional regulator [Haloferax mediterranei ATCC 33500]EMA04397.1 ArsR family transcriptional regulator [Haloferax mediterranei ATCC 33500]MDX5989517.1 helix-turn-helix domain-containing protein [Haloferax mediterranei ATCC 33500]QCQ75876.1 ArsR family transcriptional regulator [Haloferax mediterranei AT
MSSLLPLKPAAESIRDRELAPNLVALDDPAADDVLSALSSETSRQLLAAVYDDPRPASELADALDTTVQTVSYHLDRLMDANLVEPVTTWVSAQGREMAVYGPTSSAVVLFAGAERTKPRLASGLRTLVTGVGATMVGSFLVQVLWTRRQPRPRVVHAPGSADIFSPAFFAGYLDGPGALVLAVGVLLTLLVSIAVVWTQRRV